MVARINKFRSTIKSFKNISNCSINMDSKHPSDENQINFSKVMKSDNDLSMVHQTAHPQNISKIAVFQKGWLIYFLFLLT